MRPSPDLPADVQGLVERIYDVSVHDVADFLITDPDAARRLHNCSATRDVGEKLLLAERGDKLDLALFLDADILARLRDADPRDCLHDMNLEDFWLVVEGISHFIYVAWNARHDRSVTMLEMELQAEVDKFVTALYLLRRQGGSGLSRQLHRSLFERIGFHDTLDAERLTRYRDANRYAARYCRLLRRRFMRRTRRPGLITELRRFYRLGQRQKLRHIETACVMAS